MAVLSAVQIKQRLCKVSTSVSIQFNPCKPIKPKHFTSAVSPPLKDRIHCVAFVLDISSVNTLSDKMLGKLKKIHKDVVDCGKSRCINVEIVEMITIS